MKVHRNCKLWETATMPCLTAKSGFRQSEVKRNLHLHSDCHIYFTSIVYVFAYGKHI